MPRFRLALAQTNPTVGDRGKNARDLLNLARAAYDQGAQLMVSGELSLTGYPIEDLALRDNFLEISESSLKSLAEALEAEGMGDMAVVVGHPSGPHKVSSAATTLHSPARATNCASVLAGGHVQATYAKHHLPTYAVFVVFITFVRG
ncbi:MAG: nitrilase-related carbon-nitrogen hydrolase [Pontimonas sp.]